MIAFRFLLYVNIFEKWMLTSNAVLTKICSNSFYIHVGTNKFLKFILLLMFIKTLTYIFWPYIIYIKTIKNLVKLKIFKNLHSL